MFKTIGDFGKKLFQTTKLPPGPSALELFSYVILSNDPVKEHKMLDYYIQLSKKHGGIVRIPLTSFYIVSNASIFEYILRSNRNNYTRNKFLHQKKMLPVFGDSVLINEGSKWRSQRRLATPFYQHSAIKHYLPAMISLTNSFIQKWTVQLPKKTNIHTEMNHLTLRIIVKLLANTDMPDKVLRQMGPAIAYSNHYCSSALPWRWKPTIGNMRFRWCLRKIDTALLTIINQRRQQKSPPNDFLQGLLQAKHEKEERLLNQTEILAEFKTHVITGHETTACALAWTWYLLAKHPEYQNKLHLELNQVLKGHPPTWEDLPKLVLTQAILSETMRLYPPVWAAARTSIGADKIQGFDIPANASLLLNIHALQRNPEHWENPNEFYPERFLKPKADRHPFASVPFSAGPHTCIASHLAPIEMSLITAMLAQHFEFHFKGKPPKMLLSPCISLRPKNAIILYPTRRQRNHSPEK